MLAPFRSRGIRPYIIGVAAIAAATLLRYVFDSVLGEQHSFSFYFIAVAVAAWTGGLWPAVFTSILSALVGDFLFSDPFLSFAISGGEELVTLIFFILEGVVIGALSEISLIALDRAKQAEREKDNFMAAVAHEMRSPLSVIYYASTLSRMAGTEQPNDQLDVIDRQVHHLNLMIEDLLDVSRVARGKIRLNRKLVEVSTIVSGAIERTQPLVESHKHVLKVQLPSQPVTLFVDPVRVEQVLANLLTNAAKYTPNGGEILVRAEADGDNVSLAVRDNGIGISSDMLPRVFDLFVQADAGSDRAEGGLGIGLAIVHKIAKMHGGTVRATSAGKNRGSEFVVSLPLNLPSATPPELAKV